MKRRIVAILGFVLIATAVAAPPRAVRAQSGGVAAVRSSDDLAVQAREAFRLKDRAQLFALRQTAAAQEHPLASWVEYWELAVRLTDAQPAEFEAFAERWRGTYVEDRLRNDWLLELGRRRDWPTLRAEFPRFRMNDDREVTCFALLAAHLEAGASRAPTPAAASGPAAAPAAPVVGTPHADLRSAARVAWLAQRDVDDGCSLLAQTLFEQRVFGTDELWQGLRAATELNRPRLARERASMVDANLAAQVDALFKDPGRFLRDKRGSRTEASHALAVLALWRLAASDPDLAFTHLEQYEATRLPALELARAWGGVARHAALKQHVRAADFARRAFAAWDKAVGRGRPTMASAHTGQAGEAAPAAAGVHETPFSDEILAWMARAALRGPASDKTRWAVVQRAVEEMSAVEQRDPTWVYWRARALRGGAAAGPDGEGASGLARLTLESIAGPLGFYNQLALEELGRRVALPAAPVPLVESEREPARQHAGLRRAMRLMALGLRAEGVREWNYSLRGMNDRELLAAAALACEREIWDRCINTSERTRDVADVTQRYPLPFREAVVAQAREVGLDPAYVYGLIRQESRFILDARSHVGASGLMQLMPATARWTARRVGLTDWKPEQVNDRDINLLLGTTYLKLVLDEFGGTQAMGAAAYNAGPSRPRRWREGATVEPAAWIEGIPFNETRDYVKKVLSNAVVYAARLGPAAPGAAMAAASGGGSASPGGSAASGVTAQGSASGTAASISSAVPVALSPVPSPVSLRARLGGPIGPRDPGAPAENRDLP